ncbi:phage tail protein [Caballeronia sp. SEWSISQ10-4 2]|uniref:phage tail protein n=1 Tax=Caballeronia sp. SEWSISQ10-4 2 TaxID=2937438 RepID=UPI0026527D8C|nr:phage tail protein [Caballeronia sp. SEWSISQ10-4 2]MDN7179276.1 phage tail protein [Caballeronia sp. SEWSISQ10-4 2]
MSVPDPSNSKAPPSLLSGKETAEHANSSRILASLEGRVESRPERPPRSKSAYALLALLIAGAAAWGGWHYLRDARTDSRTDSPTASSISAQAGANGNKTVAAAGASSQPASAAGNSAAALKASSGVTAQVAGAQVPAVNSQAASIVAADDDNAAPKSTDRIASALANGASEELAASAAAPANKVANTTDAANKKAAKPEKTTVAQGDAKAARKSLRQDVREARDSKTSRYETLAAQNKKRPAAQNAGKLEDQDVDLLAALVSRTKPYTPPATDKRDTAAAKLSAKADAGLAARLKECGKDNFFTDEICRWRVCDGHWGKDPACPAASATNNSRN